MPSGFQVRVCAQRRFPCRIQKRMRCLLPLRSRQRIPHFGSGRVQTGESVLHPKSYGVRSTPATFLCRRGHLVNGAQVARSPVAELPAPHNLPPKQVGLRSFLFLSVAFLPCSLCLRFIPLPGLCSYFLFYCVSTPVSVIFSVAHRFGLFSAGIQSQTDFSCGVTDLQDRISLT